MLIRTGFLFLNVYVIRPLLGTTRVSNYSVYFTEPRDFSSIRKQKPFRSIYSCGSKLWVILPWRATFANVWTHFGLSQCAEGLLLASSVERPGMLLNIFRGTGQ